RPDRQGPPANPRAARGDRPDLLPLRQGVHAFCPVEARFLETRSAALARGPGEMRAGRDGEPGGPRALLRAGQLREEAVPGQMTSRTQGATCSLLWSSPDLRANIISEIS